MAQKEYITIIIIILAFCSSTVGGDQLLRKTTTLAFTFCERTDPFPRKTATAGVGFLRERSGQRAIAEENDQNQHSRSATVQQRSLHGLSYN